MKTLLSILLVVILFNINAQPSIQWQKSLGGSQYDVPYSIQQTSDGGYIIGGLSASNDGDVTGNHTSEDFWVVKLTSTGNITWQKSLGGTLGDAAESIYQTSDGGYIVAGYSNSNDGDVTGNNGGMDFWVVKLTSTGNITWQKSLGGTGHEGIRSAKSTSDGGYIVAGYSNSNDGDITGNNGGMDFWVVKLTSTGNITWQKSLGGTGFDSVNSIQQTNDGGYIVAGQSTSNDGDVTGNHASEDFWIVKLTSTGNITWQKSLGGTNQDFATSIRQVSDGGYIVAGAASSNDGDVTGNNGGMDFWVVKLTSTGNITWQKSLGGTSFEIANSIQQTIDGGYIVAGETSSNDGDVIGNVGGTDYWVVKLTSIGNITWQKSLGGSNIEKSYCVQQSSDGGYVIVGRSGSTDGDVTGNQGGADFWVVKLNDPLGIDVVTNTLNISHYPNPTNGNITIDLGEIKQNIKTTLTNILGQVILSESYALTKFINIDLDSPKGVYFLLLEVDGEVITKKIIKE